MMIRNPRFTPEKALALTAQEWADIKAALQAHFQANDGAASFADAALRALHPKLADSRVWNHVKAALGLQEG